MQKFRIAYCEKPLSSSLAEGRQMVGGVRRANVKAQITFNFRFFPAVEVDDMAFLHLRTAAGTPGVVEVSRLATGKTNELSFEIYGEKGALRFSADNPGWLEAYDTRDPGTPLGRMRGFRRGPLGFAY